MGQIIEAHLLLASQKPKAGATPEEAEKNRQAALVAVEKARANGKPVLNGRGVRFKLLEADQIMDAEDYAATLAGPEAGIIKFKNLRMRALLVAMVREVTEPGQIDLTNAKWSPVSSHELTTNWSTYFGAKETEFLERLYRSYHELDATEVEILSGKVRPVVTEG